MYVCVYIYICIHANIGSPAYFLWACGTLEYFILPEEDSNHFFLFIVFIKLHLYPYY